MTSIASGDVLLSVILYICNTGLLSFWIYRTALNGIIPNLFRIFDSHDSNSYLKVNFLNKNWMFLWLEFAQLSIVGIELPIAQQWFQQLAAAFVRQNGLAITAPIHVDVKQLSVLPLSLPKSKKW